MNYTKLNGTELTVSSVAIGTDSFGTYMTNEASEQVLDSFTELGGTIIDTAEVYANWEPGEKSRSEKCIGAWMKKKGNRHNLIIATKGGHPERSTMHISRLSEKELRCDIEGSLLRLGTDYIDIYFLHRDDVQKPVGEIMETLAAFVKEGKTRYTALSNWSIARISEAVKYCTENNLPTPAVSQIQFGLDYPNIDIIDPTLDIMQGDSFDYYSECKMPVFAFSAQSKGYFSKLAAAMPLSPKAEERYDNPVSREIFNDLQTMTGKYNCTVTELVTAVLTCNPCFTTIPILGCKNPSQVESSLGGTNIKISPEDALYIIKKGLIVHN